MNHEISFRLFLLTLLLRDGGTLNRDVVLACFIYGMRKPGSGAARNRPDSSREVGLDLIQHGKTGLT